MPTLNKHPARQDSKDKWPQPEPLRTFNLCLISYMGAGLAQLLEYLMHE